MRKQSRGVLVFVFSVTVVLSAAAQSTAVASDAPNLGTFVAKSFPDNADLRGRLFGEIIGTSRTAALAFGERQFQNSAGTVTVRAEKRTNDFLVEFLNPSVAGAGIAGRGSCFIQRDNAKGNYILQARILLEDDPSCYLVLYPSGSGTRGDVVMYGAVMKKGLYFSDMIYRILLLSFSDLVDATSRSFDWSAVFKFGPRGGGSAAELRTALAAAAAPADPAPAAQASSEPMALGSSASRFALASAPSLPATVAQDAGPKGPRSLKIASSIDRATSPETLVLELAASGESGARELSLPADSLPGFASDRGDSFSKPAYADFPRYDGRGLPLAALRAALYLDLKSNPESIYAVLGEGIRATVVPSYDEAGRLIFSVFAGGKESSYDELFSGRRDARVRIVRVPS